MIACMGNRAVAPHCFMKDSLTIKAVVLQKIRGTGGV